MSGKMQEISGDKRSLCRTISTYFHDVLEPIQAIAVDMGGVIVNNPNRSIKKEMKKRFHITQEQCEEIWTNLIPRLQTGEINEDEFWSAVTEIIPGKTLPPDYKEILTPEFTLIPEAETLLKYLNIQRKRIVFFTDTIPQHLIKLRKLIHETIWKDMEIIASPDIGAIKPKCEAYTILALRLGLPPHAICFIDDNKENIRAAQKAGVRAIQYTTFKKLKLEMSQLIAPVKK